MNQFFDAVENGDTHLVRTLLEADPALVHATDTRMTEPLGYWTKMRIKREGRPMPELRRRKQASRNSALHIAIENHQFEVAGMLLERGANANAGGGSGRPLEMAVDRWDGSASFELVTKLIASGADVNGGVPGGFTVLHRAIEAMGGNRPAPKEVVELLLRAGADVTARTGSGETPLVCLLRLRKCSERVPILKLLIQEETRCGRPTETQLLGMAASRDEPEVLRILIDAGMDVNRACEEGLRPLQHAALHGLSENVRLLLAAGADPRALDGEGRTALEYIPQKLLDGLSLLEEHVKRSAR